jgi:RHS repeat-associated protein
MRRALLLLIGILMALLAPRAAAASTPRESQTRVWASELNIAYCTYRLVDPTLRIPSRTSSPRLRLASDPPLRWKGMWRYDVAGTELYDARARMWSPALGSFLSIDEFTFHNSTTTLWGWPGQSPSRWSDPDGRCGAACVGAVIGGVGNGLYYAATASTSMSWGDFALGAAGAIGEGAAVGALAGWNPQLGFIAIGGLGVASDKDLWKLGLAAPLATGGASCPTKSGLGDLTNQEVGQIQRTVNEAQRPLEVVGSAARGERRGVGTDLPIGKGPGTRSDIDYTTAGANHGNFDGLESQLPSANPETPILRGTGDPFQGPVIRFEPGEPPQLWRPKR